MAGYWSSKARIDSLKDYGAFLTHRLSRILVPYLFWSAVLIGYSAVKSGDIGLYGTIFKLLTGGASMGYYFAIALAQLYILTPLLQYINRRFEWRGFISVVIFNLAVLFVLYLSRLFGVFGHLPIALPFYSWIIFYEMGLFVTDRCGGTLVAKRAGRYLLCAVLVCCLISIAEAWVILTEFGKWDFAGFSVKLSTYLYSICVILVFLSFRNFFGRLPKLLSSIGCFSFGIYLIHAIILNGLVKLFHEIHTISSFQPVYQFILAVTATLICFGIISIARKLLPISFCSRILGF